MAELLVAGPVRHGAFAVSPLLFADLLPLESQGASFRGDADTLLVVIMISLPQLWLLEPYKSEAPRVWVDFYLVGKEGQGSVLAVDFVLALLVVLCQKGSVESH